MRSWLAVAAVVLWAAAPVEALSPPRILISTSPLGAPLTKPSFAGGATMHVRVEVSGYAVRDGLTDLNQAVRMTTPHGVVLIDQAQTGQPNFLSGTAAQGVPATFMSTFQLPTSPAGKWRLTVTITDKIGDQTSKAEAEFEVRK